MACCLSGIGFNPLRTMARANISGVTSGFSEKSMSVSLSASARVQSVFERFVVERLLTFACFSYRDDADRFGGLCVDNRDYTTFQQTERYKTLLSIVETIVFDGYGEIVEDRFAFHKVDAMLADVGEPLRFVPFKYHCNYISSVLKGNAIEAFTEGDLVGGELLFCLCDGNDK